VLPSGAHTALFMGYVGPTRQLNYRGGSAVKPGRRVDPPDIPGQGRVGHATLTAGGGARGSSTLRRLGVHGSRGSPSELGSSAAASAVVDRAARVRIGRGTGRAQGQWGERFVGGSAVGWG